MDDVIAVKVWSAEVLLALNERLHRLIGLVDPGSPPPVGASEQDLAAFWSEEERYREEMRDSCAAYWLHVVWACLYQTMHGDLPPAQRVLVASYGVCTVLVMVTMRQFIRREFVPRRASQQDIGEEALGNERGDLQDDSRHAVGIRTRAHSG
jgi:hypothetical protein